jgi:hypothetical protein
MEPKILEEIQKHYKQEVIDFDWEPIRKEPKRYGVLYPIIGYFVSLIAGSIFFFGGIFRANGIIGEYRKIRKGSEIQKKPSEIEFPSGF